MIRNEMSRNFVSRNFIIHSFNASSKQLFTLLLTTVVALSIFANAATARNIPDLPRQIQGSSSLPVLLEFYATWCSTCQKMFPHLMEMKDKTNGRLQVIRMDIDAPQHKKWVKYYNIKGTPTYFLFNSDKKAVYVMEDMISSKVLETMVYREAGLLKAQPVPSAMVPTLNLKQRPYTFVAYHHSKCTQCDSGRALGKTLENQYADSIQFVEINSDQNKNAKAFFKSTPITKAPAYVLMDSDAHPLHYYNKPMNGKSQWRMLQLIDMMVKGQPVSN